MNHKASAMETWNVIACGTSSRPWEIPKVEVLADGLSVRGSGEELRVLGAHRPAPVRPPPRRRPAAFVSSTPAQARTSLPGALRLLGRQLGTRLPSRPGGRHFPSCGGLPKPRPLAPELAELPGHSPPPPPPPPSQAARRRSRGAAAAATRSLAR